MLTVLTHSFPTRRSSDLLLDHAGAEIVAHRVSVIKEAKELLTTFRGLEVDSHAALVAVHAEEEAALAVDIHRLEVADRVARRRFDLDHIGEIGRAHV